MKLIYCGVRNFGDQLNPWLWQRLAPELLDDDERTHFLGIGTLLSSRNQPCERRVVFSTGMGYRQPPRIDSTWDIRCVRGPRTAAALRLDATIAVSDGGMLIRRLALTPRDKIHKVSYMPHHRSAEYGDWRQTCQMAGIHYIDPEASVDRVLFDIQSTQLLLTEALHGAIAADALRVPWVATRAYGFILKFKWYDWCESVGLTYRPSTLPMLWNQPLPASRVMGNAVKRLLGHTRIGKEKWRLAPVRVHGAKQTEIVASALQKLASNVDPQLSSDAVLDRVADELLYRLDRLCHDYPSRLRAA